MTARGSAKFSVHPPDVLPAWVAEMDLSLAEPVKAALRAAVDNDDLGYLGPRQDRLIAALAGFMARRIGWTVDPAQVRVVTDVMIGVEELLHIVTGEGDGVVVTPPIYPPFFADVRHVKRTVVEAPVRDGGALDLDAIERAFAAGARALVLSHPHNPLGRVLPPAELAALADLAEAHDAWVLSDEIHAPLILPGAEFVSFVAASDAGARRGFALTSASKTFNIAGLKLGFVVTAGGPAADRAAQLPADLHWRCGYLGAVAAEAAFRDGDAWLDETLRTLDGNRALLAEQLELHLPAVRYTPPEASFLAWLDCRALGLGDDPAAAFLERGRVALSHGPDFGAPGNGFARLNIGTTPDRVVEAVTRMAAALS